MTKAVIWAETRRRSFIESYRVWEGLASLKHRILAGIVIKRLLKDENGQQESSGRNFHHF